MPKGPNGEKRPADAFQRARMIARIATGEIEDKKDDPAKRKAGGAGGTARAKTLPKAKRAAIAKKGAATRWNRSE